MKPGDIAVNEHGHLGLILSVHSSGECRGISLGVMESDSRCNSTFGDFWASTKPFIYCHVLDHLSFIPGVALKHLHGE